jgi:EmrB/QacA subfamily drug resistance transporter
MDGTDRAVQAPMAALAGAERAVLVVSVLASFVAFLDGSVVNVALPAIVRELGGGVVTSQWVIDGYLLTLGSLILLAGSISDAYGRRRVLIAGILGFGVASLACAVAPSAALLIVARLVQGFAGALLVPSSLAMIMSTFSGAAQSTAIGRWSAWTSGAFIAGPVLGGGLVDLVGWRWIFGINVIPIAAALLVLRGIPRDSPHARRPRLDGIGAVLAALGLAGPVFALIEHDRLGWTSAAILAPLLAGVAALVAFLLWERRARDPMLPLALFRIRNFAWGNLATSVNYAALALGPLALTLFLQQSAGFSATLAGLAGLPGSVLMLIFGGRAGTLAGRFGFRRMMTLGALLMAAGFAWLMLVRDPFDFWWQVLPGLVIFGFGLTAMVPALTSAVLSSIPPERNGIASAVNNAVARIAGLVAVACLGLIVGGGAVGGADLHAAALVVAVLFLLGALAAFVGIRRPESSPQAP